VDLLLMLLLPRPLLTLLLFNTLLVGDPTLFVLTLVLPDLLLLLLLALVVFPTLPLYLLMLLLPTRFILLLLPPDLLVSLFRLLLPQNLLIPLLGLPLYLLLTLLVLPRFLLLPARFLLLLLLCPSLLLLLSLPLRRFRTPLFALLSHRRTLFLFLSLLGLLLSLLGLALLLLFPTPSALLLRQGVSAHRKHQCARRKDSSSRTSNIDTFHCFPLIHSMVPPARCRTLLTVSAIGVPPARTQQIRALRPHAVDR
jgi:hypothetical protein